MKIIKNILKSFGIAFIGTIFDFFHKKFGGLASGERYSDPHSIDELINMYPSFLLTFLVIFICCFVFFQIANKKKQFINLVPQQNLWVALVIGRSPRP